jgi:hypothetical protein
LTGQLGSALQHTGPPPIASVVELADEDTPPALVFDVASPRVVLEVAFVPLALLLPDAPPAEDELLLAVELDEASLLVMPLSPPEDSADPPQES